MPDINNEIYQARDWSGGDEITADSLDRIENTIEAHDAIIKQINSNTDTHTNEIEELDNNIEELQLKSQQATMNLSMLEPIFSTTIDIENASTRHQYWQTEQDNDKTYISTTFGERNGSYCFALSPVEVFSGETIKIMFHPAISQSEDDVVKAVIYAKKEEEDENDENSIARYEVIDTKQYFNNQEQILFYTVPEDVTHIFLTKRGAYQVFLYRTNQELNLYNIQNRLNEVISTTNNLFYFTNTQNRTYNNVQLEFLSNSKIKITNPINTKGGKVYLTLNGNVSISSAKFQPNIPSGTYYIYFSSEYNTSSARIWIRYRTQNDYEENPARWQSIKYHTEPKLELQLTAPTEMYVYLNGQNMNGVDSGGNHYDIFSFMITTNPEGSYVDGGITAHDKNAHVEIEKAQSSIETINADIVGLSNAINLLQPDYKSLQSYGTDTDLYLYHKLKIIPDCYIALKEKPDLEEFYDYEKARNYLDTKLAEVPEGKHFIFYTDVHWRHNNHYSTPLIEYIRKRLNIRTVLMGGDILVSESSRALGAYQLGVYEQDIVSAVGSNILITIGDHDNNTARLDNTAVETKYQLCCRATPYFEIEKIFMDPIKYVVHREDIATLMARYSIINENAQEVTSEEEPSSEEPSSDGEGDIIIEDEPEGSDSSDPPFHPGDSTNDINAPGDSSGQQYNGWPENGDWDELWAQEGELNELIAFLRLHYYADDTEQRIRYIVLASGCGHNGILDKLFYLRGTEVLLLQTEWLYETLMNTPENYDVVVLLHNGLTLKKYKNDPAENSTKRKLQYAGTPQTIARMLSACKAKKKITFKYTNFGNNVAKRYVERNQENYDNPLWKIYSYLNGQSKTYDFTHVRNFNNILMLTGDCHKNLSGIASATGSESYFPIPYEERVNSDLTGNGIKNGDVLVVSTQADSALNDPPWTDWLWPDSKVDVINNPISQQAIEIVTIDDNHNITFTRIGAGRDRVFNMNEGYTASIPNKYHHDESITIEINNEEPYPITTQLSGIIRWTSSDDKIVSIENIDDTTINITGLRTGECVITADNLEHDIEYWYVKVINSET